MKNKINKTTRFVLMKRVAENGNLFTEYSNGDWEKDSQYYLIDRHGNTYNIIACYNKDIDDIYYECQASIINASTSIKDMIQENNEALKGIAKILNPFKIEF